MFRTADELEDLDVKYELLSYDTVLDVNENHQIFEDKYRDADFYVVLSNDSELDEIKEMLDNTGFWAAYFEIDDEVIRHN